MAASSINGAIIQVVNLSAWTLNAMYKKLPHFSTFRDESARSGTIEKAISEKVRVLEEKGSVVCIADYVQNDVQGAYEINHQRLENGVKILEERQNNLLKIRSQVKKIEAEFVEAKVRKARFAEEYKNKLSETTDEVEKKKGDLQKADLQKAKRYIETSASQIQNIDQAILRCESTLEDLKRKERDAIELYERSLENVNAELNAKKELKALIKTQIGSAEQKIQEIQRKIF